MKNSERSQARRDKILDVAESLFLEKGYEGTTIQDIMDRSGLAKGSIYYHYESKEDVLDGIVQRRGDANILAAWRIARTESLAAPAKLLMAMLSQAPQDERQRQLTAEYERASAGLMFVKSLTDIVLRLAPVIADIIEQGISEGAFATPCPLESAQILLAAAHALFDNAELPWTPAEQAQKVGALILVAERVLGAEPGTLADLAQTIK